MVLYIPTKTVGKLKGAADMIYQEFRMTTCMYMDMAMPMPTFSRAHLLPFRNVRDRMCFS